MKKFLLILLALMMCISMCSCGDKIEKEDLVGTWSLENKQYIFTFVFTEEKTFGYTYFEIDGADVNEDVNEYEGGSGTYSIRDDGVRIFLYFDDVGPFGSRCEVATIEDGMLCIERTYKLTKDN